MTFTVAGGGTSTVGVIEKPGRRVKLGVLVALVVLPMTALADESPADPPLVDFPTLWATQKHVSLASLAASDISLVSNTEPMPWGSQKSYLIPALDIIGFDVLLNLSNRAIYGCCDYNTTVNSIQDNLHHDWVVDSDGFTVNQLGHPYQGSMYHGFARSAGLGFWTSLGYTFAGSMAWEIAGETTPPSKNDQIMTGIGGSFLGEPLFRMANLLLEEGGSNPEWWRKLGSAAISPSTAFNRIAFGDRFKGLYPSGDPAYYSQLQLGGVGTAHDRGNSTDDFKRNEGLVYYSLDYGLPGKPEYSYTRPFDYFNFAIAASTANAVESVNTRGLLIGKEYESGDNYRGVWGLYGGYDYLAPQIFRVSSTALSLGTTARWALSNAVELQGTGTAGVGYTAVGSIHDPGNTHDNHYGVSPQALLALRFIFADRASLDVTGREYFVSNLGAGTADGHDNILRADASLTFRVHNQHAIALKYVVTRRDASFSTSSDLIQTRGIIGIFYTLLGHERLASTTN